MDSDNRNCFNGNRINEGKLFLLMTAQMRNLRHLPGSLLRRVWADRQFAHTHFTDKTEKSVFPAL
jgi:hypothetical protein